MNHRRQQSCMLNGCSELTCNMHVPHVSFHMSSDVATAGFGKVTDNPVFLLLYQHVYMLHGTSVVRTNGNRCQLSDPKSEQSFSNPGITYDE